MEAREGDAAEVARQSALKHLDAVRPEADRVLQEVVDGARALLGVDLSMLNLALPDVLYFRAWSGKLPPELATARQDPRERSMCRHVVGEEKPLVVKDILKNESFRDQHHYVHYGMRFYVGVPLVTSGGDTIGTLCLLHTEPREVGDEEMQTLSALAWAAIGRIELLGALATKHRFVSAVSHELRTPLTSIKGYLEGLLADEAGPLNDEQREYVEVSYLNAVRLHVLSDDLLTHSLLDSSRFAFEPELLEVGELLRETEKSLRPAAQEKRLFLSVSAPPGLYVVGDRLRTLQVFDNLVGNAIKFTLPSCSVKLTARRRGAEEVVIEVADEGVGIPAPEIPYLTKQFFRASSTAHVEPGVGMGLSIVEEFVERQGGRLEIESKEGEGSIFRVVLPARARE